MLPRCAVVVMVPVLLALGVTVAPGPAPEAGARATVPRSDSTWPAAGQHPTLPVGHADRDPVGRWPLWPVPEVVHDFDPPQRRWGAGHRGVDLAGRLGQPVRSALPGRIRYAGPLAGRGVVVVDHGSTRTTYEPVEPRVTMGDRVTAGQVIGRLGVALGHCRPRACLHWGWLRGEVYLDPLDLVGAGPVRLLPLWREDPAGAGAPAQARGWAWR